MPKKEQKAWMKKAVEQGEPDAMCSFALHLLEDHDRSDFLLICPKRRRTNSLLQEAAEFGICGGQFLFAQQSVAEVDFEFFVWLRRAAATGSQEALDLLFTKMYNQLDLREQGGSGRGVFEMGMALKSRDWRDECPDESYGQRCIELYEQWCDEARTAVLCWIWLAQSRNVCNDVRLLIADLIWEDRSAWSERCEEGADERFWKKINRGNGTGSQLRSNRFQSSSRQILLQIKVASRALVCGLETAVVGRPDGLVLKEAHRVEKTLFVGHEAMEHSSGQYNQLSCSRHHPNPSVLTFATNEIRTNQTESVLAFSSLQSKYPPPSIMKRISSS